MKKNKVNPVMILIGVLLVALIVVGVVLIVLLTRKEEEPQAAAPSQYVERQGGSGTVLTEDNYEEALANLQALDPKYASYTTTMNVDWTFATWDTPSSDVYVENADTNGCPVYFDVSLADSGEIYYTSPDIPLGGRLVDFALSKELSAGTYPAVVTYHLLDENNNSVTEVAVAVTLTITN